MGAHDIEVEYVRADCRKRLFCAWKLSKIQNGAGAVWG